MMEKIIKKQSDRMIRYYEQAKEIIFPEPVTIKIDDLKSYNVSDYDNHFDKLKQRNAIYIISSKELKFTHSIIKLKFDELKEKRKNFHISKINNKLYWVPNNQEYILYVGSKEKSLNQRMKQHLGLLEGRSVYSLYLKDWWPENVPLIIKIWSFDDDLDFEILQILEDCIWEEYKPLFGKKGATFNRNNV